MVDGRCATTLRRLVIFNLLASASPREAGADPSPLLQDAGSYPLDGPPPVPQGEVRGGQGDVAPPAAGVPGIAKLSPGLVPRQAGIEPEGLDIEVPSASHPPSLNEPHRAYYCFPPALREEVHHSALTWGVSPLLAPRRGRLVTNTPFDDSRTRVDNSPRPPRGPRLPGEGPAFQVTRLARTVRSLN